MASDSACPNGGKHKLVTDHESGEMSCSKCAITIKVKDATGYTDEYGIPKNSSDGPVTGQSGLGSKKLRRKDFRQIASVAPEWIKSTRFEKEVGDANRQIEISSGTLLPKRVQTRALTLFKQARHGTQRRGRLKEKIVICEKADESPLGPIKVILTSSYIDRIIDWIVSRHDET